MKTLYQALFLLNIGLLCKPVVTVKLSISPREGSIAGGTWITLTLEDLDSIQSDTNNFQWDLFLVKPSAPRIGCDVFPVYSSLSVIKCRTRPSWQEGLYNMELIVGGQMVNYTGGTRCTFQFTSRNMPVIYQVNPPSGIPGTMLQVYGWIYTRRFETYEFNVEQIDGPIILESQRDALKTVCSFVNKKSKIVYPAQIHFGTGTLQCCIEGSYIGSQNVSFSVFNKGRSMINKDAWRISAKQELFLYQTHPEILAVNPMSGSLAGGTDITIAGNFFNDLITVAVAGIPCTKTRYSSNEIVCTTGSIQRSTGLMRPHPGNRGLLFEVWDNTELGGNLTEATLGYSWQFVPNASSPQHFLMGVVRTFSARLRGFFVAPDTNNYTFWIQAYGKAALYLSQSEDATEKVKVASIPSSISKWADNWEYNWDEEWQQKSEKIQLSGGRKYYMEAMYHGKSLNREMKVGIQLHNTWLKPEVVNTYYRERQEIRVRVDWLPEIQRLTVTGTGWISLTWENVSSSFIPANATAAQLLSAIEQILSVNCENNSPSADIFLQAGFEQGTEDPDTEGYRVSWAEPYCGRFSVYNPQHLLRATRDSSSRYDVTKYTHICFGYKGYITGGFIVTLIHNNRLFQSVRSNITCVWNPDNTSPASWKFVCVDLWHSCLVNSTILLDLTKEAPVLVEQIDLISVAEDEAIDWIFVDEVIVTNTNIKVFPVDPRPARPGGNLIQTVNVTGSAPNYSLTLLVAECGTRLPLIALGDAFLAEGSTHPNSDYAMFVGWNSINITVQRSQSASPPLGGVFRIHLPGVIIPRIPVNVSSHRLQNLLRTNSNNYIAQYFNTSDFTVTKDFNTCYQNIWTLTWPNTTGDLPNLINVTNENITGLNPSIKARVVYDGGVFIGPMFGDMLATANNFTQVTAHVSDIPASCSGSCAFQYHQNSTPLVDDVKSWVEMRQIHILIAGSNLTENISAVEVFVGQSRCVVGSANRTQISCTRAELPAGRYSLSVLIFPDGYAMRADGTELYVTVRPKLLDIQPSSSSEIGGIPVTLIGTNLDPFSLVWFGSQPCVVNRTRSNSSWIECTAPTKCQGEDGLVNITVMAGNETTILPHAFDYDPALNPVILSLSRNYSNIAGDQVLFIEVSNISTYTGADIVVKVHDTETVVTYQTSDGISVSLPALPPGLYNISVSINGININSSGCALVIHYLSEVYNISPCCGSLLGGTILTISGHGFSANSSLITVLLNSSVCDIINSTEERIECWTPPVTNRPNGDPEDLWATVTVTISNISSENRLLFYNISNSFVYSYQSNSTPQVTNISIDTASGNIVLNLEATDLENSAVFLGDTHCEFQTLEEMDGSSLNCTLELEDLEAGSYPIRVLHSKLGYAIILSEIRDYTVIPAISSISPSYGSLCGGTLLTISGFALQSSRGSVEVPLGANHTCDVQSVNYSAIICDIRTTEVFGQSSNIYQSLNVTAVVNLMTSVCDGNCSVSISEDWTPVVDSVTVVFNTTFFTLLLSGQHLTNVTSDINVQVDDGSNCNMILVSEGLVECEPDTTLFPGTHNVSVFIHGRGRACFVNNSGTFNVIPQMLNLYPNRFGIHGGGQLTIEGIALMGKTVPSVVRIGNDNCTISNISYKAVLCIVPPGNGTATVTVEIDGIYVLSNEIYYIEDYTPVLLSLMPLENSVLSLNGSGFSSDMHRVQILIGENICMNLRSNSSTFNCQIPSLPTGEYQVKGFDVLKGWASSSLVIMIELTITSSNPSFGCFDGSQVTIKGTGFSPSNSTVTVCGAPCDISSEPSATVLTCVTQPLDASLVTLCSLTVSEDNSCNATSAPYILCDITIRVGTQASTLPGAFMYACDDAICASTRNINIAAGSSRAIIAGLFLSPKVEKDEVLIYNGSCNVSMAMKAVIECEVFRQPEPVTMKISETLGRWGQNIQSNFSIRFCGYWSQNSSWLMGYPPQDGDNVTVENGQTLLLDTNTSVLYFLHVKGGKLLFLDNEPIKLQAHYILVSDDGELQIGTPNIPFKAKAEIILYGSSHTPEIMPYGVKFLAVRNATLSLHGLIPEVSVTYLKTSAEVNDTSVQLVRPVDWCRGDRIVISGTDFRDFGEMEEVVTVETVNGTEIIFHPPLRFSHSYNEQWLNGERVAVRATVALLSRNIVIRGNLTTERLRHLQLCGEAGIGNDNECLYGRSQHVLGALELGATIIVRAFQLEQTVICLEGIEFQHVGQAFHRHVYALNFAGDASMNDSYIRGCSIWDSFGRGIGLNSIYNLKVEKNVLFNISGHGILLEDGEEKGVKMVNNTVIGISGTDGLSNIESVSPAGFYIKAPTNFIENNEVCTSGYGFLYHLPPGGSSRAPLGSFSMNTAHSCLRYGLWVYPEYHPQDGSSLSPAIFQTFTAWKNQGGAQMFKSGNIELRSFWVYSCKEFGIDLVEIQSNSCISDSLVLGHLSNQDTRCMSAGIKTPKRYNGLLISNTTYANFDLGSCRAIVTCSGCRTGQGGFTINVQQLFFINSPNRVAFPFPHAAVLRDLDGSLSETKGGWVLPTMRTLPASCQEHANFSQPAVGGSVCKMNISVHRMSVGLAKAPKQQCKMTLTNSKNQSTTVNYVNDTLSNWYGWMALLLDTETYTMVFNNLVFSNKLQYSATFDNFSPGSYLLIQHRNLPLSLSVAVRCGKIKGQSLQSLPSPDNNSTCDWFFNSSERTVTYLVAGIGRINVTFKAEEIVEVTTQIPPSASTILGPSNPLVSISMWSSPLSWEGVAEGWGGYNHSVPGPEDDVIVLPGRTILVDVDLPPLRGLYILGKLEFPINRSNALYVHCIVLLGGELIIGNSENALQSNETMQIKLKTSEAVGCNRLNGIDVEAGTIGVYGKLQINSSYSTQTWTHLGFDISPGNERIVLEDDVSWRLGDNIVITPSSYDPHETESVTMRDIQGQNIQLRERLLHRHIGSSYVVDEGHHISLAAEVGLLTRNVQITADGDCIAWIVVGQKRNTTSGELYSGILQVSNVEFVRIGKRGHSAIEFSNISPGSQMISCSIHHICGCAVHSVASSGILLRDNVIYNTEGHGLNLEGQNHILIRNLIVLTRQPVNGAEWVAGIKVNLVDNVKLLNNVVAGSERLGYYINGQQCFQQESPWSGNVAHSNLHGIHLYTGDGFQCCTKISGFLAHKNYDYGIFLHIQSSVLVSNVTLVDNGVGLLPMVYGASAQENKCEKNYIEIQKSVIIGTSSTFDCFKDRIKPTLKSDLAYNVHAPRTPSQGRIGILWPAFTSKPGEGPNRPWHQITSYSAVHGITKLEDVTFSGFMKSCYSVDSDTCFMSNPENYGIMHPIVAEGTRMLHIKEQNKFYFHSPEASVDEAGNGLQCPQPGCNSRRKTLFKDLDGSAMGVPPPSSVFPQSDFSWSQSCFYTGIYRGWGKCIYIRDWQGYLCKQIEHVMVVMENLDTDADVRKLTPVTSTTEDFIDILCVSEVLGTCSNMNCILSDPSVFYFIVPAQKLTKICFNGLTPQTLRFHLIYQKNIKTIVAIFYSTPQHLSVYYRGSYVRPSSISVSEILNSDHPGTNFLSYADNILYILLTGDDPIEVHTSVAIHISFSLPGIINAQQKNILIKQLIDILAVKKSQIRIVQEMNGSSVIADSFLKRRLQCPSLTSCTDPETTRIKRKAFLQENGNDTSNTVKHGNVRHTKSSSSLVLVEVSDLPPLSLSHTTNANATFLSSEKLNNLAIGIVNAQQTGELEKCLGLQVDLMMVSQSIPLAGTNRTLNFSYSSTDSLVYVRPQQLYILIQPSDGEVEKPLQIQPVVIFLDKEGQRVKSVGHPSSPWTMTASLQGSAISAILKGLTNIELQDGWANFTNLAVSSPGSDYSLSFNISSPKGSNFTIKSKPFTISPVPKREPINIVVAAVLGSIIVFVVFCALAAFWYKKSKTNTKVKVELFDATEKEESRKVSRIRFQHRLPHIHPLRIEEEDENDFDSSEEEDYQDKRKWDRMPANYITGDPQEFKGKGTHQLGETTSKTILAGSCESSGIRGNQTAKSRHFGKEGSSKKQAICNPKIRKRNQRPLYSNDVRPRYSSKEPQQLCVKDLDAFNIDPQLHCYSESAKVDGDDLVLLSIKDKRSLHRQEIRNEISNIWHQAENTSEKDSDIFSLTSRDLGGSGTQPRISGKERTSQ
ncbi:fibrocystin-like [Heptranchias perlo]|uniref:fibrocystin-like n=1 Tax=Heptranchias perlo TaxID=212740 RepID=UPI003559585B